MQIPPATEAAWATDLAQYLEDEDQVRVGIGVGPTCLDSHAYRPSDYLLTYLLDQDTFAVSTRVAAQQCVLELLDWYVT